MNVGSIKVLLKKHPVASLASVVALIAVAAFAFRRSEVSELQAKFDEASNDSQRHSNNITHSSQLDEQLKQLEAANLVIASRLVDPQDLAVNLQYFYKLEAESGVKLLGTRPSSPGQKSAPAKGGYRAVQYDVSLQGGFTRVLTFLRKLEQGNNYCRVVTADCRLASEGGAEKKETPDIVLSLTVEILGKG